MHWDPIGSNNTGKKIPHRGDWDIQRDTKTHISTGRYEWLGMIKLNMSCTIWGNFVFRQLGHLHCRGHRPVKWLIVCDISQPDSIINGNINGVPCNLSIWEMIMSALCCVVCKVNKKCPMNTLNFYFGFFWTKSLIQLIYY